MRVLLVDDDPLILDSIAEVLSFDGHDVAVASNGQAALDCFSAALDTSSPFEVVVTDLGMPMVNGIQVANGVRALSGTVRIILLTGWGERARDEKDYPLAVNHLLGKPVRIDELRAALDS
ncbi:MAG TPA: response regulator [Steroidobacteraceae bacterium]|jgi:DNA-binding response OmpR family regulator